jgi:O-antigen ligase
VGLQRLPMIARAGLFALLPAAGAGGAMALPVLLGAAGTVSFRPALARYIFEKRPLALGLLAAFAAWVATSSLWSAYPNHMQAPRMLATLGLGLVFAAAATEAPERPLTRAGGAGAFIVLATMLAAEALWDMPLNRAFGGSAPAWMIERNPARGVTVLLGLAWPFAASLIWRGGAACRAAALATIAAAGALAVQFHDFGNVAAFLAGVLAFAAGLIAPALALRAVTGALALWIVASPVLTPLLFSSERLVELLPYSWAVRANVWRYVCARIGEAPWFGHGLDASRTVTDVIAVHGVVQRAIPLHPHSGSLQIWFETGAVGALLAASALTVGGGALARAFAANKPKAAAACAAFAAIGVSANVSYGLWQEWWNAAILLSAALVGALPAAARPRP